MYTVKFGKGIVTLYRSKLKIEQHEPHESPAICSCDNGCYVDYLPINNYWINPRLAVDRCNS